MSTNIPFSNTAALCVEPSSYQAHAHHLIKTEPFVHLIELILCCILAAEKNEQLLCGARTSADRH